MPLPSDAEAVYVMSRDPAFLEHVSTVDEATQSAYSLEDAKAHLAELEAYNRTGAPGWAIILDSNLVGIVRTRPGSEAGLLEVGYSVAKSHQGKGIASEALRLIQRYTQDSMQQVGLEAFCHPNNAASQRVLERCDFLGPKISEDRRMRYVWAAASPLPTLL